MDRTSIMLPTELKSKAMQYARQHNISLGELIRDCLTQTCINNEITIDPFFADNHIFQGKAPTDVAKNHDDYLY